jgi:hypothetical protein
MLRVFHTKTQEAFSGSRCPVFSKSPLGQRMPNYLGWNECKGPCNCRARCAG